MAETLLSTILQIDLNGYHFSRVSPGNIFEPANQDGNFFRNNERMILGVYTAGIVLGSTVVKIRSQRSYTHVPLSVEDLEVTIDSDDIAYIGPFPSYIFNDAEGYVHVEYDVSWANLRVGVFKLG